MLDLQDDLSRIIDSEAARTEDIIATVANDAFWRSLRHLYVSFREISSMIGVAEASDSRLSNSFERFSNF